MKDQDRYAYNIGRDLREAYLQLTNASYSLEFDVLERPINFENIRSTLLILKKEILHMEQILTSKSNKK